MAGMQFPRASSFNMGPISHRNARHLMETTYRCTLSRRLPSIALMRGKGVVGFARNNFGG